MTEILIVMNFMGSSSIDEQKYRKVHMHACMPNLVHVALKNQIFPGILKWFCDDCTAITYLLQGII